MIAHVTQIAETPPAPKLRPADRPSLLFRALLGLSAVVAAAFNVAILMSDRAPGFFRRVFGDFAQRVSNRLDANARAEVFREGGLPESDAIVHIGMWGAATLLIALTIWTWRGLLLASIATLTVSSVLEIAQGTFTKSRNVEFSDVMANAVGVAAGATTAATCFVVWSAVSGFARGIRRPRR